MTRITSFAQYQSVYQFALEKPEVFWAQQAKEFTWKKPWDTVLT
jgi:acetyl-CoA synthetase